MSEFCKALEKAIKEEKLASGEYESLLDMFDREGKVLLAEKEMPSDMRTDVIEDTKEEIRNIDVEERTHLAALERIRRDVCPLGE